MAVARVQNTEFILTKFTDSHQTCIFVHIRTILKTNYNFCKLTKPGFISLQITAKTNMTECVSKIDR